MGNRDRKPVSAPPPDQAPVFEEALAELEELIGELEQGELDLQESLRRFERGVELTRTCQQALRLVEQKVQVLLSKDLESAPEPFDADD